MKRWFVAVIFAGSLAVPAIAAKGPEVDMVDNKLSINAEAVSLGRLLKLFDLATGMKSKVPAELANRNISVKFTGMNVTDGVRKIFQGQTLDYVLVEGAGVIVTAVSQSSGGSDSPAPYNPPPQVEQPFVQDFQQQPGTIQTPFGPAQPNPQQPGQQNPQQQQPAMIQTPFGPMANPNAPRQQQPNSPLSAPGQQNSLFPSALPSNQLPNQQASPQFPGSQPFANPTPFGTPTPPQNNPTINNNLFGSPPGFNNQQQQHAP